MAEKKTKKRPRDKEGKFAPKAKTGIMPMRDSRLDELMPLMIDILSRVLGSIGMMRYRKDFVARVKEIMNEEEAN